MTVRLSGIRKSYGNVDVIYGVDLDIHKGEFVVFVGPSGCGKSTLLRMIAGLEDISGGDLFIEDVRVNAMPPSQRGIAMVFQSYALYPHLSVFENMAFGLRIAKLPRGEIQRRVTAAADILQLTPLLERLPKALSGGQRQRVAIGRAIVREPKVFLFDEPLSNLDAALRVATRIEIAKLHADLIGATMIYVTHDQVEAMTLADRIVVLSKGRVEQVGAPLTLYERPDNLFVATFIGSPAMNVLSETLVNGGDVPTIGLAGGGSLSLGEPIDQAHAGREIRLGVRPEHLVPCDASAAQITGTVTMTESLGEVTLAHVNAVGSGEGQPMIAKLPGIVPLKRGQTVHFRAEPSQYHVFAPEGLALLQRG